jgi:hypothetical protein
MVPVQPGCWHFVPSWTAAAGGVVGVVALLAGADVVVEPAAGGMPQTSQ